MTTNGEFETTCPASIRDTGHYSARNTSKGALVNEAARVLRSLHDGHSLESVRDRVLSGEVLEQRSRPNRKRIWTLIRQRYLVDELPWLTTILSQASATVPESTEFVSLLYLLYALRDHLTFDVVTQIVWEKSLETPPLVSRNDVLDLMIHAADKQPQIERWSESTRVKLAGSILTALRDFGVLEGKQKKTVIRPPLPPATAEALLRILTAEGIRGREVIESESWRLFLRSESEVASELAALSRDGRIRFERVGGTVVLDTPTEWEGDA